MGCFAGTLTCDDIKFKHSFGPVNCDPELDIGGLISVCDLCQGLDCLFNSLDPKTSRQGLEDYRCFYIKNEHLTDTLRNAKVWLEGTGRMVPGKRGGSYVAMGIPVSHEIQTIHIVEAVPFGRPNEGDFMIISLSDCIPYSPAFTVFYDPNLTKWEGNFQNAIRAIEGMKETRVTVSTPTPPPDFYPPLDVTFTIDFGATDWTDGSFRRLKPQGQARSRDMLPASIVHFMDNVLVQGAPPTVPTTATVVVDGSPICTTAPCCFKFSPPPGVVFDYPFEGNPVEIGNLRPGEYFPVWIRRTTPPNTYTRILDDFTVRIDGTYP